MRQFINLVEEFLIEDFDTGRFLERVRGVMELVRRGATEGERVAAKAAFDRMIDRAKQEIARMREPDSGVSHAQIDRFMAALKQIGANSETPKSPPPRQPPPREPPREAKFKKGQWVVHMDDGSIGKVSAVFRHHRTVNDWEFQYGVNLSSGEAEQFDERYLRPATQAEIDAALSKRSKTTSSGKMAGFNITMMARYVNRAENSNKVYGVLQKLDTGRIYTFWGGWQKPLKVKYYPLEEDAIHQFKLKIRRGYEEISPGTDTEDWVMKALKIEFSRIGESRRSATRNADLYNPLFA